MYWEFRLSLESCCLFLITSSIYLKVDDSVESYVGVRPLTSPLYSSQLPLVDWVTMLSASEEGHIKHVISSNCSVEKKAVK